MVGNRYDRGRFTSASGPSPCYALRSLLPHLPTCLSNKAASFRNTLGDCSAKGSCTGLGAMGRRQSRGTHGGLAGVLPPPGRAFRSALRVEAWSTRSRLLGGFVTAGSV